MIQHLFHQCWRQWSPLQAIAQGILLVGWVLAEQQLEKFFYIRHLAIHHPAMLAKAGMVGLQNQFIHGYINAQFCQLPWQIRVMPRGNVQRVTLLQFGVIFLTVQVAGVGGEQCFQVEFAALAA